MRSRDGHACLVMMALLLFGREIATLLSIILSHRSAVCSILNTETKHHSIAQERSQHMLPCVSVRMMVPLPWRDVLVEMMDRHIDEHAPADRMMVTFLFENHGERK